MCSGIHIVFYHEASVTRAALVRSAVGAPRGCRPCLGIAEASLKHRARICDTLLYRQAHNMIDERISLVRKLRMSHIFVN